VGTGMVSFSNSSQFCYRIKSTVIEISTELFVFTCSPMSVSLIRLFAFPSLVSSVLRKPKILK